MRLASARQPEREDVVAALDEAAFAERRQHLRDLRRQARPRERREGLLRRQIGGLEKALRAPAAALVHLELGKVMKILAEGPPSRPDLREAAQPDHVAAHAGTSHGRPSSSSAGRLSYSPLETHVVRRAPRTRGHISRSRSSLAGAPATALCRGHGQRRVGARHEHLGGRPQVRWICREETRTLRSRPWSRLCGRRRLSSAVSCASRWRRFLLAERLGEDIAGAIAMWLERVRPDETPIVAIGHSHLTVARERMKTRA